MDYASGLSEYHDKGICGLPEIRDSVDEVEEKMKVLASWINSSKHVVIFVGAGLSTKSGIPDFRGPNGVWTLEEKGIKKTDSNISFDEAKPTLSHMALATLIEHKKISFIVSQNVDGLFLKTGIRRKFISELHGNFFLDECNVCKSRFVRSSCSDTMGLKVSEVPCPRSSRPCRGFLRDTILDWEDELPSSELRKAALMSQKADLCICLGTSLQIVPAANLPFLCKKNGGRVCIINLQKTKFDTKADLVIHENLDDVFLHLIKILGLEVNKYDPLKDLTKAASQSQCTWK